jgi:hypothetical protein
MNEIIDLFLVRFLTFSVIEALQVGVASRSFSSRASKQNFDELN